MIYQERGFPPADRKWMGCPTDIQLRALEVIATTRYAWAARGAADESDAEHARFAQQLLRLALDAKSSSAVRARGIRARSRRRASSQFAT